MAEPGKIAVVIPVGPEQHHARWLTECLKSVALQTRPADFVLIVDDMHDGLDGPGDWAPEGLPPVETYRPPWRLGVAHAFNHGVAKAFEAGADLAVMLGADDILEERVLAEIERTWERRKRADGYYWCEVLYSGSGEMDGQTQALPCNCAAVTPKLWETTGGFPIESASGACDAALISILMIHKPKSLIQVAGRPAARFIHRQHEQQQTRNQPPGIIPIRGWLTETYEPTQWGRYA